METENKQPFEVTDLSSLTWTMKKIAEMNKKKKENETVANEQIESIKQWLEEVNKPLNDSIEYLGSLATHYHRMVREQDPKQKTLSTPYGKVKSRESKASVAQGDKKKLLEYVLSNDIEAVKQDLDWATLKKQLAVADDKVINVETGEVVPGAVVKPHEIKFSVEVAE